ncbi:efflux RND transporter periplasmic adaptor subunit [Methylocapsa sp. S129]|uniref:efflux RND transporter periplasmic adaptor subunit n=1 Tax=Methylocapsa sp. S129 TaxID=1641869 RepID=UPI001AEF0ADF|nr:efflux RND transporter periplasmic adaptor subunit [Methylocapsa sp. S129]
MKATGAAYRSAGRRLAFLPLAALLAASSGRAAFAQETTPGAGGPALAQTGVTPEIRAQLTPREFTTLSSEMAGRIDHIATRVGEHFQKGVVLIVFDCALQRAEEARAQAALTQAQKTFAIDQRLVALKSMGQLQLDVAAADVQKARAEVAAAEATTSKCTIAAPFTGVTVEQKAREFQYTTPGQPLLDIIDDHGLDVELIVPSRWLNLLKPGYEFQVHIEETDKAYPARITRLGGRVDPVSQSIKVIGEITADAPELMAGMSGRASIAPPASTPK